MPKKCIRTLQKQKEHCRSEVQELSSQARAKQPSASRQPTKVKEEATEAEQRAATVRCFALQQKLKVKPKQQQQKKIIMRAAIRTVLLGNSISFTEHQPLCVGIKPNELLIKVKSAAINPVDYKLPRFIGGKIVGFDQSLVPWPIMQ